MRYFTTKRIRVILVLFLLMGGSLMRAQMLKLDSIAIPNSYKCRFEYDDRSNCILRIDYSFYSNDWHIRAISEYSYNDLDLLTSSLIREDAIHKIDFNYNDQNLLAEEIKSYYNGTSWCFDDKKIYEYNTDGKQTLSVEYDYRDGDWLEIEKRVWEYEDNKLLSMTLYRVGVLFEKDIYRYNQQGLCSEISFYYNNQNPIGFGEWIEHYRELFEYDDEGNMVTRISLQKRMDSNELVYKKKKEFIYDTDSNCVHMDFYHSYDHDLGQWSNNLMTSFVYTYDNSISSSNIIGFHFACKEILDSFDLDVPVFNKLQQIVKNDYLGVMYQCNFYYSKWNALDESIENYLKVWPNPASTTVFVDGVEFAEVLVYNALGQLVKETKENVIDLSAQEAGTYILKVITPSGVVTKQIIKN